MKKLVIAGAAFLIAAGSSFAQQPPPPPGPADAGSGQMRRRHLLRPALVVRGKQAGGTARMARECHPALQGSAFQD